MEINFLLALIFGIVFLFEVINSTGFWVHSQQL